MQLRQLGIETLANPTSSNVRIQHGFVGVGSLTQHDAAFRNSGDYLALHSTPLWYLHPDFLLKIQSCLYGSTHAMLRSTSTIVQS